MKEGGLLFLVEGSEEQPYMVTIVKRANNLTVLCTCKAAEYKLSCKHRLNILKNDPVNILNLNIDNFNLVQKWIKGSDVEITINELKKMEKIFEMAKENVKIAKHNLLLSLED